MTALDRVARGPACMSRAAWLLVLIVGGCRCEAPLRPSEQGPLLVSPPSLTFDDTTPGEQRSLSLQVSNGGVTARRVELGVPAPFSVSAASIELAGGAGVELEVGFLPTDVGAFEAVLEVGDVAVPLQGRAIAPVTCAAGACETARWDVRSRGCVVAPKAEGEACSSSCITQGRCAAGLCVGEARSCDDGNPCTVDACGVTGCSSTPLECASPSPCQVATCQRDAGCVLSDLVDGTECGDDDCVSNTSQVCIAGQCLRRERPEGPCPRGWVLGTFPGRGAAAYDELRQRTVVFDGLTRTTWQWNGVSWVQRFPQTSPPRGVYSMVWAGPRQRLEAFGASFGLGSTELWSYDGAEWTSQNAPGAPSPRVGASVAFDVARNRLVVFGGRGNTQPLGDLWEWDGLRWSEVRAVSSPAPREQAVMAFDPLRRRVVLFGGQVGSRLLSDTWEWDGSQWVEVPVTGPPPSSSGGFAWDPVQRAVLLIGGSRLANDRTWLFDGAWRAAGLATPGPRFGSGLVTDGQRRRVVLFGGLALRPDGTSSGSLFDTWEWDGASWTRRSDDPSPGPGALAADTARGRVVLFESSTARTWEWDGIRWTQPGTPLTPRSRVLHQLVYDPVRARTVLMGGGDSFSVFGDTWSWDGRSWTEEAGANGPAARAYHAMAWDGVTQRVLLTAGWTNANGAVSWFDETWWWTGTAWLPAGPGPAPRPEKPSMVLDEARQRVVLVATGHDPSNGFVPQTWEWDGARWTALGAARGPPAATQALAWHSRLRSVVLYVGALDAGVADTWTWDGGTWAPLPPSPVRPRLGAMAYHADRQRLVLLNDEGTWVYVP